MKDSSPYVPRYVIGIDGGGTKTAAALAQIREDGAVDTVAHAVAGPSNLQSLPLQRVQQNVEAAIENLFLDLPTTEPSVEAICFGMAGYSSVSHREAFGDWASRLPFTRRVLLTHDARPLVAAGTEQDAGIALIAGTGSFAYARNAAGEETHCGGWGCLFGDEGSAYWLTLEALRAASHACDGRAAPTALVDAFLQWLDCEVPEQWLVQLRERTPDQVAQGAALVSQAAAAGDRVAQNLVRSAADQLASLVHHLAVEKGMGPAVDLALSGGLLLNDDLLRTSLLERLEQRGTPIRRWQAVPHPVEGAVRIAAASCQAPVS